MKLSGIFFSNCFLGHSVLVFVKQGAAGPRKKSIPEEFMNKYHGKPGRIPKTPTPVLVDINRKRKSKGTEKENNQVKSPNNTSQIQIINVSPGFGPPTTNITNSNIKIDPTTTTTVPALPTKMSINPAPVGHLKKKCIEFDPTKSPEYALASAKIYDFYTPTTTEPQTNQLLEMVVPIITNRNRKTSGTTDNTNNSNSEEESCSKSGAKNNWKSKVTIDNISPIGKCEKCKKLIDTKYGIMNFKALCLECLKSVLGSTFIIQSG